MKPALTAEEWTEALSSGYPPVDSCSYESDRFPHKNAALCLYGQPFGFTPSDILTLENAASFYREYVQRFRPAGAPDTLLDEAARADDLADRIEALLPPGHPFPRRVVERSA